MIIDTAEPMANSLRRIMDSHLLRSDAPKVRHDKMVELVTRMMELKKQQARAPKKQSTGAKQLLDQKLAITDQQIDALVFEHYNLTEKEIRIVEALVPAGKKESHGK
jgi:hypothetical protein